jgi:hypothetical protein
MTAERPRALDGGCTCHAVRYRLLAAPLFVHCCHCRWCQRETGAAFALNALIEADRVQLVHGEPDVVDTPSGGRRVLRPDALLAQAKPGATRRAARSRHPRVTRIAGQASSGGSYAHCKARLTRTTRRV